MNDIEIKQIAYKVVGDIDVKEDRYRRSENKLDFLAQKFCENELSNQIFEFIRTGQRCADVVLKGYACVDYTNDIEVYSRIFKILREVDSEKIQFVFEYDANFVPTKAIIISKCVNV
jgi:hypothetical protein